VLPGDVPVWVSGRWGPRHVRVDQCSAILAAEIVYDELICDGAPLGAGWRATLPWAPQGPLAPSWDVEAEVVANAIWRRGRLFFRCASCHRRATRLYVPVAGLEPRCRRCWGLNYESQSWSYKPCALLAGLGLGPVGHITTANARSERRRAARARYDARRAFL
jgi:hypothetical protein